MIHMESKAAKKVNSFETFKRANKQRIIIEKCKELMYKDPNLTTKQLGKN